MSSSLADIPTQQVVLDHPRLVLPRPPRTSLGRCRPRRPPLVPRSAAPRPPLHAALHPARPRPPHPAHPSSDILPHARRRAPPASAPPRPLAAYGRRALGARRRPLTAPGSPGARPAPRRLVERRRCRTKRRFRPRDAVRRARAGQLDDLAGGVGRPVRDVGAVELDAVAAGGELVGERERERQEGARRGGARGVGLEGGGAERQRQSASLCVLSLSPKARTSCTRVADSRTCTQSRPPSSSRASSRFRPSIPSSSPSPARQPSSTPSRRTSPSSPLYLASSARLSR